MSIFKKSKKTPNLGNKIDSIDLMDLVNLGDLKVIGMVVIILIMFFTYRNTHHVKNLYVEKVTQLQNEAKVANKMFKIQEQQIKRLEAQIQKLESEVNETKSKQDNLVSRGDFKVIDLNYTEPQKVLKEISISTILGFIKKKRPYLYRSLGKKIPIESFINTYYQKLGFKESIFKQGVINNKLNKYTDEVELFDIVKVNDKYGIYIGKGLAVFSVDEAITIVNIENEVNITSYRAYERNMERLFNRVNNYLDDKERDWPNLTLHGVVSAIAEYLKQNKEFVNVNTVTNLIKFLKSES